MRDVVQIGLAAPRPSLAERESVALSGGDQDALSALARASGTGLVMLSTCNRVEVYAEGTPGDAEAVRSAWAARVGVDPSQLHVTAGSDAVRHLVRVAAGLESAVLGEDQILGQVRRARAEAMRHRTLSPLLAEAFREALAAGRRVRTRTALAQGVASTASAAVALASRTLGGLAGRDVVVVGGARSGGCSSSTSPRRRRGA